MPLLPLTHSLHGGTSTAASTLVLSGILSGAALAALFNALIGYLKDQSAFRRQKLEEIHRSVFTMTLALQPSLIALKMELDHRKNLLDQQRGYALVRRGGQNLETFQMPVSQEGFSQEKLDNCNERIRHLREAFPRDRVLNELEVFVRLTSVYFKGLVDERYPVTNQVMDAVRLHSYAPEHQVTIGQDKETDHAQKLIFNGDKMGHRLFGRIWELSEPGAFAAFRFRNRKTQLLDKARQPFSPPSGTSKPPTA